MSFKVGDEVKYLYSSNSPDIGLPETTYTIKCAPKPNEYYILDGTDRGNKCPCGKHSWITNDSEIKLTKSSKPNMEKLTDKMALVFKKEPEKSFIKAGVMNMDETLTTEGRQVFEAFLLRKHSDDFKKEVVDVILAEDEKESKA